jgi:arabinofuranosyltransferase
MRKSAVWIAAATLLGLLLLAQMVRLAWISDDAYITLRTIENWLAGHGPVWNPGERVQTYTHPLWMLMLAGARALTGEHYFTTICLGLLLSSATALLLVRLSRTAAAATAVLAVLLASRAFGDFSTSGLESPLVFALLALLAATAASDLAPRPRLLLTALLSGLLATTRMDLALLCAPVLLAASRSVPLLRAAWLAALGMLPFAAWCAFALVYYGTPIPITAYAKAIAVGVAPLDLVRQGWFYVEYVATNDPLTLLAIALGIAFGLLRGELRCRALALGTLLYCGYVVKVGGDFMGGRFFAPPFVAALAIAARALARASGARAPLAVAAAALLLAFAPGLPSALTPPADDQPPTTAYHGILDERRFYYGASGLLSPSRTIPVADAASRLPMLQGREHPAVFAHGQVGRWGFEAGDLVHIVDPWLCDPLLMRLPVWDQKGWRIGHFIRRVPEGYLETVASGSNRIVHPGLRRYYEALHAVITEPVFCEARLHTLWRMWCGDFDGDLRTYVDDDYRREPRVRVSARELAHAQPMLPWFDLVLPRIVYEGGIAVLFEQPIDARTLRVQLVGDIVYRLRFVRGDQEIARTTVDMRRMAAFPGDPRLHDQEVPVPAEAAGFTAVFVDALNPNSEHVCCIGSLVPVQG